MAVRKFDRSSLLILLYCIFVLMFTVYGIGHFRFGQHKGIDWWFFIRFLLISGYVFYILQGLILKSTNWGILLLIPLAILLAATIAFYALVGVIRWGGGDLLDKDGPDMILGSSLYLTGAVYALRFIKKRKTRRP